ncbi:c-type cytochrome [Rubricoccus marinus]|uniref:Cytochrome c domain-containing protein n=1 Tax=Rubricoccus marinus TaxID=716817 RepID=A0A259TUW0_9BACT|nr:cytochrome c [Rubricoccus marinus]OZC01417.1 hypothetical protein BSZ36_17185 [Rubricoccus marinus]
MADSTLPGDADAPRPEDAAVPTSDEAQARAAQAGAAQPALAPAGAAQQTEQAEPLDLLSPYYREQNLAAEGAEAPPFALWVTIFGVVLFSVFYLGANVGDFSTYPWLQQPQAAGVAAAAAPVAVDGAQLYTSRCANCHQADGTGVANVNPPLAGSSWVTGDKGVLIRILLHGMNGPVEVLGATYNGNMPAWAILSDEEIAAVTTHERTSWGNAAEPITAAEVAAIRELTASRSQPWTAAELQDPANQGVPAGAAPEADAPEASGDDAPPDSAAADA